MNDEFLKFFEAAKALIIYVEKENVFDRSSDMGCGGYDTYQSETFYELITNAKKALGVIEAAMKKPE